MNDSEAISIQASCVCIGDSFSPKRVTGLPNLLVHDANEPGEIGTRGRFKGQPIPHGSCTIVPSAELVRSVKSPLLALIKVLREHQHALRDAGMSNWVLSITINYSDQCNFELTEDEIKMLAELGVGIGMMCIAR